jgi:hypothetical protein
MDIHELLVLMFLIVTHELLGLRELMVTKAIPAFRGLKATQEPLVRLVLRDRDQLGLN